MRRTLYWSEPIPDTLTRANLDGSDPVVVMTGVSITDMAMDARGERLWMTDIFSGTIRTVGLDGTGLEVVLDGLPEPTHLGLFFERPISVSPASWAGIKARYR